MKKKIKIDDLEYFDKLDIINSLYYQKQLEEYRDSLIYNKHSNKEITEIENKIAATKQKIEKIDHLEQQASIAQNEIYKVAEKQIIINYFKNFTLELAGIKEQYTPFEDDLSHSFFIETRSMSKKLSNVTDSEVKQVYKKRNLNKLIDDVSGLNVLLPEGIYDENDVLPYVDGGYDYINIRDLNLKKHTEKKLFQSNDYKNSIENSIYKELLEKYSVLGYDSFNRKEKEEKLDLIESIGIDYKKIEELIENIRKTRKVNSVTHDVSFNLGTIPKTVEGYDIVDKINDMKRLSDKIKKDAFSYKVNSYQIDEIVKLYEPMVEQSININIMETLLSSFSKLKDKCPEYFEVVEKFTQDLRKEFEKEYANAERKYNEQNMDDILKDSKALNRTYSQIAREELDLELLKQGKTATIDDYENVAKEEKEIKKEQDEIINNSPYLTSEKKEKVEHEIRLVESIKENDYKYSDIRSLYLQKYYIEMAKNDNCSFIEYLEKQNKDNLIDLINNEKNKNELLDIVYDEFKSKYQEERWLNVNSFKHYCEYSNLIRELGGIDSIIKSSDIENYIQNEKNKKEKNKNQELYDMFDDEEKDNVISDSKIM